MWKKKHCIGVEREGERSSIQVAALLKEFTYEDLWYATHDFKVNLGEGGFGSVFEGAMMNGTKIAVKCLNNKGGKDFLAAVKTVGSVHHFNLVRLLGYCIESSHKILVNEYMCNGSLDKWIFKKNEAQSLNWGKNGRSLLG